MLLYFIENIQFIILFIACLFMVTVYFVTKISLQYNIAITNKLNIFLDKPIHRSSHKIITPRSGGISLFLIIFPFLFIFDLYLALYATLMFSVGLVDDYKALNNKLKLILISIFTFSLCFYKLDLININSYFELFFVFMIMICIIIGFNFIDGLNGVAGFLSYVTLFTILIIHLFLSHFNYIYILVILISLISFLELNLKGRIFMGDSGTMFLGSIISYLLLDLLDQNLIKSIDMIFFSGVFIIDLIAIIIYRICILKVSPFIADRNHIHHTIFYSNKRSLTLTLSYLIFIHLSIISIPLMKLV